MFQKNIMHEIDSTWSLIIGLIQHHFFQNLHLLSIYGLVNFNTFLFMHKAYYGNLPASLQSYFKKSTDDCIY